MYGAPSYQVKKNNLFPYFSKFFHLLLQSLSLIICALGLANDVLRAEGWHMGVACLLNRKYTGAVILHKP